ncbi:MAG: hypothetical protein M3Z56_00045 [Bacteroidota bacterium]|nr:hypothetical protein [Bacteroidota bacterium]
MNNDLHNIDDLFKKALEEHTEQASAGVWDGIDKNLDKRKVVSISKRYNKLKWVAAILVLFSAGMAMYTLYIHSKNKELVKQNKAGKTLPNQHSNTQNSLEDSDSVVMNNNLVIENAKNNNESHLKENKKLIQTNKSENKSIADSGLVQKKSKDFNNTALLITKEKIIQTGNKQEQKKLFDKRKSAIQVITKSPETDEGNNKTNHAAEPIVSNMEPRNALQKQQEKSNEINPSVQEKYLSAIPLLSFIKDRFQHLILNPLSQIPSALTNTNTNTLNDGQNALSKQHSNYNTRLSKRSPFSATVFFSPDLVSTNIKDDHPRFREDDRHKIQQNEDIRFSSTIGLLIDYALGNNWMLGSGLTYSTRIIGIKPKTIYARPDDNGNVNFRYNCSAGYSFVNVTSSNVPVAGDSLNALHSSNTLEYIGVPLVVKHKFTKGRFSLITGAGIAANFLTKGNIETTVQTSTGNKSVSTNKIEGLKSLYFNGSVLAGAEYKLSRTLGIAFTPTARFAITSINKDTPVKTNLNSVGLTVGVTIKL